MARKPLAAVNIFLLLSILFLNTEGISQENKTRSPFNKMNVIDLELLGPGGVYSINYERVLINGDKNKSTIRAGIGVITEIYFPVFYNHLFSFNKHHFELGIGTVLIWDVPDVYDMYVMGGLNIGYRFQKPDGKFMFKASYTPIIDLSYIEYQDVQIYPIWIGVTFGRCF